MSNIGMSIGYYFPHHNTNNVNIYLHILLIFKDFYAKLTTLIEIVTSYNMFHICVLVLYVGLKYRKTENWKTETGSATFAMRCVYEVN